MVLQWEGTPYMSGQRVQGAGVDCIRFGCGVIDEMSRLYRILPQNLPLDTAIHAPKTARAAMHKLLRLFPELDQVQPDADGIWAVEPGDLVVVGPLFGGPGHLILVGWEPNTCWEAVEPAVRRIGIGLDRRCNHVFHVYRSNDRGAWL